MLGDIIYKKLDELAEFSKDGEGVTRLPFTKEHKEAITWLEDLMNSANLTTKIDNIGNLIGEYKSPTKNAKTLVIGSHQDSVINGGKYDGALGIVLPIMCFKNFYETHGALNYNIKFIAFADEEGVSFQTAFLTSKAVVGSFTPDLLERVRYDGKTLKKSLENFGLNADISECKINDVDTFLELHIEQGPILDNKNLSLGIVDAIQGIERYHVEITGFAGHSGTIPMDMRRDAGVGAAFVISRITEFAENLKNIVVTVGCLELIPGAVNVIPGKSIFSIDIRAMDPLLIKTMVDKINSVLSETCEKRDLSFVLERKMKADSTICSKNVINMLEESMKSAGVPIFHMTSGAGHDAQEMATIMDAGMLFIRCKKGISHNKEESVMTEDIDVACKVLAEYFKCYK